MSNLTATPDDIRVMQSLICRDQGAEQPRLSETFARDWFEFYSNYADPARNYKNDTLWIEIKSPVCTIESPPPLPYEPDDIPF